jgi:hypothetical protein
MSNAHVPISIWLAFAALMFLLNRQDRMRGLLYFEYSKVQRVLLAWHRFYPRTLEYMDVPHSL